MNIGKRPTTKRVRVALDVIDDEGPAAPREVFPDGTYDASSAGHFAAVDRAAQAFVNRTLGREAGGEGEEGRKWAGKAVGAIEGSMYELSRALGVVEALRTKEGRLLEMRRIGEGNKKQVELGSTREQRALLMSKRQSLRKAAKLLEDKAEMMRKWLKEDDSFCEGLKLLKRQGGGVRRDTRGLPLLDVGDGNFVRTKNSGAPTYLEFPIVGAARLYSAITEITQSCRPCPAHCFSDIAYESITNVDTTSKGIGKGAEQSWKISEKEVNRLLCRLRASRLSAYKRLTFENLAEKVSGTELHISSTSSSVAIDCGPSHILYTGLGRTNTTTQALEAKESASSVENQVQDASVVQSVLLKSRMDQLEDKVEAVGIHERVLRAIEPLMTIRALTAVLDHSADLLSVRVDWERGATSLQNSHIRIWASSADECGPDRLIARVGITDSDTQEGGEISRGSVKITPAFGVITTAPEDAGGRVRPAIPAFQLVSASPSAVSKIDGLDDAPRGFLCPVVGGEVHSIICVLMCVRLLDALESAASSVVPDILDVDRFGFTIEVNPIRRNRTIRADVWPRGAAAGDEVVSLTVTLDGKRVDGFPEVSHGQIRAWINIIRKVLKEDEAAGNASARARGSEVDAPALVMNDTGGENHRGTDLPYLNGTLRSEDDDTTPLRQVLQNGPL